MEKDLFFKGFVFVQQPMWKLYSRNSSKYKHIITIIILLLMLPCSKRFFHSILFKSHWTVKLLQTTRDKVAHYRENTLDHDWLLSTNLHVHYHRAVHLYYLYIQRKIAFHDNGIKLYRACNKMYFTNFDTLLRQLDPQQRQQFLIFYYKFTCMK